MSKRTHPLQSLPDPAPAQAAAIVAMLAAFAAIFIFLLEVVPPQGWHMGEERLVTLRTTELVRAMTMGWAKLPELETIGDAASWVIVAATGPMEQLVLRGVAAQMLCLGIAALLGAWAIGVDVYRSRLRTQPRVKAVTTAIGSEPRFGPFGASVLEDAWQQRRLTEGEGIRLAPGVIMPRDVESEHIALLGATGGGKSTILEGLLRQAIRRGDRALLVDVKGHLGQRLGIKNTAEISLVPGSSSTIWRIGVDIRNRQDATELAAALIPQSRDPIWSDGGRLYLTGLVVALQRKHRSKWGWQHLQAFLALPFPDQEALILQSMPDVTALLQKRDGDPTATVMSILVTVIANVGSLVWAMAEREKARGSYFSLRAWAAGKSRAQVVIMRLEYDQERCLASTLLGNQVVDGRDNSIWLGLDELPRFCDAQTVERLVALGRSRGIRIVAALQTPSQLRREIGADATTALLANFGIQIISRIAPGPERKEISDAWFGMRTVTWTDPATDKASGAVQTKEIAVLSEAELTGQLGKFYRLDGRPFIRAAVTGFEHVPILDWPVGWADRF
jgi:hypothetical protein